MAVFTPVKTPCIGVCSTGIGDSVCRGCKRFGHEVIHWNGYSDDQRRVIARRLESYLSQIVANYIAITDQKLLLMQITHQQIRFKHEQDPYCWVFDLLRAGASQINQLADFGLQLQAGCESLSLPQIRDDIDRDFYALSCAYYERYIAPGLEAQQQ
ncbi:MAG TPA: DUF1289 domain-containing protein [Cellvibrionaceae bacterium]